MDLFVPHEHRLAPGQRTLSGSHAIPYHWNAAPYDPREEWRRAHGVAAHVA